MTIEFIPFLVHCATKLTYELGTLSTEAGGWASGFCTLFTGQLLRFLDLLQCVLDIKQIVDVESCLEASHTTGRELGGVSTLGTDNRELSLSITDHHLIKTVLAVDMETG